MSKYEIPKGLKGPKIEKSDRQKFLTVKQLNQLLGCVEATGKPKWKRDHCGIYLGFYLGLRCSEAVILERDSFRYMMDDSQILIRTKKQLPRVPMVCKPCGRRWRISSLRIGTDYVPTCPRCGATHKLPNVKKADRTPPERTLPVVESRVVEYIEDYLANEMRPKQRWLLESTEGQRLSVQQLRRIFNSYLVRCGLPPEYSYHALRHGRGVLIWERFQDHVMVRDSLRQKSLSAAEIYMHMSPARRKEYQDVLDAAMDEEVDD